MGQENPRSSRDIRKCKTAGALAVSVRAVVMTLFVTTTNRPPPGISHLVSLLLDLLLVNFVSDDY
jgi:hypothetical protein